MKSHFVELGSNESEKAFWLFIYGSVNTAGPLWDSWWLLAIAIFDQSLK